MNNTQPSTQRPALAQFLSSIPQFLDSAWHATVGHWRTGPGTPGQVQALRSLVLAALDGCCGPEPASLRRRAELATSLDRLLDLREVFYSGIARARCQGAAASFLVRFDRIAPQRPRALPSRRRSPRHAH